MTTVALVGAAFVALAVARSLYGTSARAALAVAWLTLLFFAYGPVHTALVTAFFGQGTTGGEASDPNLHYSLLAATALCLALGWWFIARMREQPAQRILGGVLVGLVVALISVLVQFIVNWRASGNAPRSIATAATARTTDTGRPDIYYVILDGYARADTLRESYGFDNSAFIDALQSRSFQVTQNNAANYNWTFLSLASSLNLDYLQDLMRDRLDPRSSDLTLLYDAIRDNTAARFLRERGYSIVHIQSTWTGTSENPYADQQIRCAGGLFTNEFIRALADMSALKAISDNVSTDLAECHLSNFRTLGAIGARPGPKFVFAHFILPHHPYLFDAHGQVLRHATVSDQFEFQKKLWEDKHSYLEQLQFVNSMILRAIDEIVSGSGSQPVIIVQSDHGPNLRAGLTLEQQVAVRLPNFAAFRLPGAPANLVPDTGTPVNYFRRVFNHYFDAGFPILPDHWYYSAYGTPLKFSEVADLTSGKPHLLEGPTTLSVE